MEKNEGSILKYGFRKEPKIRRFMYSMLMVLLYFFGIGIPFVLGYILKITKRISNEKNINQAPNYRPIKPLMKNGLIVGFYVTLLLAIPALGVTLTDYLVNSYVTFGSLDTFDIAIVNGVAAGLLVAFVCGTYLLPVTICAVAVDDRWISGLDFKSMSNIVYSRSYLKLYLKFMLISLIIGILVWICVTLIVLIPLALVLWFVYITTLGQLFGHYARKIKEKDLGN